MAPRCYSFHCVKVDRLRGDLGSACLAQRQPLAMSPQFGLEPLPNKAAAMGRIEAMPAPYQRSANAELPDVIFYWAA